MKTNSSLTIQLQQLRRYSSCYSYSLTLVYASQPRFSFCLLYILETNIMLNQIHEIKVTVKLHLILPLMMDDSYILLVDHPLRWMNILILYAKYKEQLITAVERQLFMLLFCSDYKNMLRYSPYSLMGRYSGWHCGITRAL